MAHRLSCCLELHRSLNCGLRASWRLHRKQVKLTMSRIWPLKQWLFVPIFVGKVFRTPERRDPSARFAPALERSLSLCLLFSTAALSQGPARTLENFLAEAVELEKAQNYSGAEKVYQQA